MLIIYQGGNFMAKIAEVIQLMGQIAPSRLAEEWDNVGLQVGDTEQKVENVLIALDFNKDVMQEAKDKNCQLIITHHPLIFNGIKSVNTHNQTGKLIIDLIKNNIALFSAHTNLDIAEEGLNDYLINKFDVENIELLKTTAKDNYYKLVTFVPADNLEEIKNALFEKGAGEFKNYSHSGFYQKGRGNFKPLAEADPYLGEKNKINEVEEFRFETIVSKQNLDKVISQLIKTHPYEQPAWDLYKMENLAEEKGIGRTADLKKEVDLTQFLNEVKEKFELENLKYVESNQKKLKKIALCSGSGADFIKDAFYKGADLYLTGDLKYHEAQMAEELGIALIDFGHYGSEKFVRELLLEKLKEKSNKKLKSEVTFIKSEIKTSPWDYL